METINYEDAIPTQRLHTVWKFFCAMSANELCAKIMNVFIERNSAIGLQTDSTVLRDMVGGSGDVFIVTNSFLMLVTAY